MKKKESNIFTRLIILGVLACILCLVIYNKDFSAWCWDLFLETVETVNTILIRLRDRLGLAPVQFS